MAALVSRLPLAMEQQWFIAHTAKGLCPHWPWSMAKVGTLEYGYSGATPQLLTNHVGHGQVQVIIADRAPGKSSKNLQASFTGVCATQQPGLYVTWRQTLNEATEVKAGFLQVTGVKWWLPPSPLVRNGIRGQGQPLLILAQWPTRQLLSSTQGCWSCSLYLTWKLEPTQILAINILLVFLLLERHGPHIITSKANGLYPNSSSNPECRLDMSYGQNTWCNDTIQGHPGTTLNHLSSNDDKLFKGENSIDSMFGDR